jgi:ribosomal protein L22
MADEPEKQEKPKRRRRKKPPEETSASSPRRSPDATEAPEAPDASGPESDVSSEASADEIEPTPQDVEAEEQAADVVLEAETEIDEDSEPEAAGEPEAEEAETAEEPDEETDEEPEAPAKPAPRRGRRERKPGPPPVVRARAKYVRTSARKARLVCDHIRGKSVEDARAILAHAPRAVARDWSKLLESAVANAEHNHELVGEDLYVKSVQADEGPTIKRYRPRALGRATRIRKRTSHLTILLTPKD